MQHVVFYRDSPPQRAVGAQWTLPLPARICPVLVFPYSVVFYFLTAYLFQQSSKYFFFAYRNYFLSPHALCDKFRPRPYCIHATFIFPSVYKRKKKVHVFPVTDRTNYYIEPTRLSASASRRTREVRDAPGDDRWSEAGFLVILVSWWSALVWIHWSGREGMAVVLKETCHSCHAAPRPSVCQFVIYTPPCSLFWAAPQPFIWHTLLIPVSYFLLPFPAVHPSRCTCSLSLSAPTHLTCRVLTKPHNWLLSPWYFLSSGCCRMSGQPPFIPFIF